ncbi:hypothetical protein [Alkalibacterium sp.]
MVQNIILIFTLIPLYVLSFYSYFYPEESFLLGRRWQYKEEPEISESAITAIKFTSVITMISLTMIIVFSFTDNNFIRLFSFIGLIFYIIVRGHQLLPK